MKKISALCTLLCVLLTLCLLPRFQQPVEAASLDYYGRSALAKLSNADGLLYAYDQLAAGVETSQSSITVRNGNTKITVPELSVVMDAYRRDYAHHFWLDNSYSYSYDGTYINSVRPTYLLSGAALTSAQTAFEARIQSILSGVKSSMTQQEKALYIHDTLAGMIVYTSGTTHAHNAYGALVEGKCVCEGYAEAYQVLLHRVGIQSFLAIGDGYSGGSWGGHEWNYVQLNGKYYQTDLTWDDPGSTLYHAYYNLTDSMMLEDHRLDATGYDLPTCNSLDDNYFYQSDAYLTDYTVEKVGQLLMDNGLTVHVYIPSPGTASAFIQWYRSNASAIIRSAGVYGGASYGYSTLGREVVIYVKPSCTHTGMTLIPETPATCQQNGTKAYYSCSCGGYFTDATATTRINNLEAWLQGDGVIIGEHAYTILFGYKGPDGHGNTCVCGLVDYVEPHRFYSHNYCVACGWVKQDPVATVQNGDAIQEFYTLTDAIYACSEGSILTLHADATGELSFAGTLILDLNGYDLNGSIDGGAIYVMDTQTADYTVDDAAGYGKIAGAATHLQPAPGYMKVTEEDGTSFHRVELTLTSVTLRSSVAGMYYNCSFLGDAVVAANVQRYGVAFAVDRQPDATDPGTCSWYDSFIPGTAGNQASGALLRGIMKLGHSATVNSKNAQLAVYGRPYLLTTDGTYIFGDSASRSLRQQVEAIDDMWDTLTDLQKSELSAMYNTYRDVMSIWDIPNLQAANQRS